MYEPTRLYQNELKKAFLDAGLSETGASSPGTKLDAQKALGIKIAVARRHGLLGQPAADQSASFRPGATLGSLILEPQPRH